MVKNLQPWAWSTSKRKPQIQLKVHHTNGGFMGTIFNQILTVEVVQTQ